MPDNGKKRVLKKPTTVREQAAKEIDKPKKRRLRTTVSKVGRPIRKAQEIGKKSYFLPIPNNRLGRFLNKPRKVTPRFLREAWGELKQVTWPTRKETLKLTTAVFIFAVVFGVIVSVVDFGLDKVFKELLINR